MSTIDDKLALANENVPKTYMAGKSCKDMTDFSYYFFGGARSEMFDYINTSSGVNFKGMFQTSKKLESIPQLNTSKGTNFYNMFYDCNSLTTIPQLDTSKGIDFTQMFSRCTNLTTIPQIDTSRGKRFKGMFESCENLTSIPKLDTHNGEDFSYMFSYCKKLTTIPNLSTGNASTLYSMFSNCTNLTTIPEIINGNITDNTTYTSMVRYCPNLTSVTFNYPIKYSITLKESPKLTVECLQSIVNKLQRYDTVSQTITLSSTSWNVLESTTPPLGYVTWKDYIYSHKRWNYA